MENNSEESEDTRTRLQILQSSQTTAQRASCHGDVSRGTFAEAPAVTVLSVKSCVQSGLYWVFSELFVHIVFLAGSVAVTLIPFT